MAKEDKSNAALNKLMAEISTRSENKSGQNVSDASKGEKAFIESLKGLKGQELLDAIKRGSRNPKGFAGEENKPDADGYRAGGSVNISNFKGSF